MSCKHGTTNSEEGTSLTTHQLCRKSTVQKNGMKWSSLILSDDELGFLNRLSAKFLTIGNCLESRPGVVTAANDFFIVNEKVVNDYNLHRFAKPIVQKGVYVNGSAVFNHNSHTNLVRTEKPSFFLDFNSYELSSDTLVDDYLNIGLQNQLEQRYKCKKREFWYKVPIVEPGAVFFFKRSNEYPKILKNSSSVYTTDTAYNVYPRKGFKINSIVYSFYNPLTLCFAELLGRHYGGGVLELIPSEFRKLPIPYIKVDAKTFGKFSRAFDKKSSILDTLEDSGRYILSDISDISDVDVDRLMEIYKKLVNRRFSKSRKGIRYK